MSSSDEGESRKAWEPVVRDGIRMNGRWAGRAIKVLAPKPAAPKPAAPKPAAPKPAAPKLKVRKVLPSTSKGRGKRATRETVSDESSTDDEEVVAKKEKVPRTKIESDDSVDSEALESAEEDAEEIAKKEALNAEERKKEAERIEAMKEGVLARIAKADEEIRENMEGKESSEDEKENAEEGNDAEQDTVDCVDEEGNKFIVPAANAMIMQAIDAAADGENMPFGNEPIMALMETEAPEGD